MKGGHAGVECRWMCEKNKIPINQERKPGKRSFLLCDFGKERQKSVHLQTIDDNT